MGTEQGRSVDHTTDETNLRIRGILTRIGGGLSTGASLMLAPTSLFAAAVEVGVGRPVAAGVIFVVGEASAVTLGVIGSRLRRKGRILDFRSGRRKLRPNISVKDL